MIKTLLCIFGFSCLFSDVPIAFDGPAAPEAGLCASPFCRNVVVLHTKFDEDEHFARRNEPSLIFGQKYRPAGSAEINWVSRRHVMEVVFVVSKNLPDPSCLHSRHGSNGRIHFDVSCWSLAVVSCVHGKSNFCNPMALIDSETGWVSGPFKIKNRNVSSYLSNSDISGNASDFLRFSQSKNDCGQARSGKDADPKRPVGHALLREQICFKRINRSVAVAVAVIFGLVGGWVAFYLATYRKRRPFFRVILACVGIFCLCGFGWVVNLC